MVSHAGERPGYNVETKERVYELIERGFPGAALNGCITHMPKGYASELTSHEGEDFLYLIEGEMLYEIDGKAYLVVAVPPAGGGGGNQSPAMAAARQAIADLPTGYIAFSLPDR